MTDYNNQGMKFKTQKNERPSATQVDGGGIPVVPVTSGSTYFTENTFEQPKYEIPIHDPTPQYLAIWVANAAPNNIYKLLKEVLLTDTIFTPLFRSLGLWFDKSNDVGIIEMDVVVVHGPGGPPYNFTSLLPEKIPIRVDDIDKKEELILSLDIQPGVVPGGGNLLAIAIIFNPIGGYKETEPAFIGTQEGIGTEIQLLPITLNGTQLTPGTPYNKTPMCRFYPAVERGVRIAGSSGSIINPNSPNNVVCLQEMNVLLAEQTEVEICKEEHNQGGGFAGVPIAGRIKRLRYEFQDIDDTALPDCLLFRLYRTPLNWPGIVLPVRNYGDIHLLKDFSIVMPVDQIAATNANYFEFFGDCLSSLGLMKGMLVHNVNEDTYGQIFRVEEGTVLIAGVPTTYTRFWAYDVASISPPGLLAWNAGDTASFVFDPKGTGVLLDKFRATVEWEVDIPYQLFTVNINDIEYKLWVEIVPFGGDPPIRGKVLLSIEEDNRVAKCNPSLIYAGTDSVDKKW